MGGKSSQSTQTVSIPPQVLAQYQTVNAAAQKTAQTPFQTYSGQFVAPVNAEQTTGIGNTNKAANEAQPYYAGATSDLNTAQAGTVPLNQAATGLAAASAGAVNPTDLNAASINKYLSPYLSTVLGSESALLNQNNQQQQSGQLGTAIQSGAFGGDRTGLAAANLAQQQNLANANIYSNILNSGYESALSTAQQQQGVGLGAAQANRAALANAGQELAGIGQTQYGEGASTSAARAALGAGAQGAALQGAQAQLGAGTLQQQTQQAQDTALYNQFLQQQSYPFQVDQFLANIAEGTGALSGSTTTTTQPGGFFSDRRLKHDIRKIGETFDHQPIYSYKMHGDHRTHIGLMAQNVERKHPEAVGLAGGYKTVDYGKATKEAANDGHFASGGVASDGGRVWRPAAFAVGGSPSIVDPNELGAILDAQRGMYAPMSGGAGFYGGPGGNVPRGGSSRVPAPSGAVPNLVTASGLRSQPSPVENVKAFTDMTKGLTDTGRQAVGLYNAYKKAHPGQPSGPETTPAASEGPPKPTPADTPGSTPPAQTTTTTSPEGLGAANLDNVVNFADYAARGGRQGLAQGGDPYSYDQDPTALSIPDVNSHNQLAKAPDLPKSGGSGMQNMGQMLSLVSDIMDIAAARGGRIGKDAGGALDDQGPDNNAAHDSVDVAGSLPGNGQGGGGSEVMSLIGDAIKAYGIYAALAAAKGGRIGKDDGGSIDDNAPDDTAIPPVLHGGNNLQSLDVWPPPGYKRPVWWGDPSNPNEDMGGKNFGMKPGGWDDTGKPHHAPQGLRAAPAASASVPAPAASSAAPPAPAPSSPVRYTEGVGLSPPPDVDAGPTPTAAPTQSWWDALKHSELAKPENLIPLLTAIGTMGVTPTRSLGVAASAGLLGGAKSYLDTRQSLADIQQTGAETGRIQSGTEGQNIRNVEQLQNQYGLSPGFALVPDPNGPIVAPDGKRYRQVTKASLLSGDHTGQRPPTAYQYLGKNGMDTANGAYIRYTTADQGARGDSNKQIDDITSSGNAAQQNMLKINHMEQVIASNRGLLAPGAFNDFRTNAVNLWNTGVQQIGHPEWAIDGLADAQMTKKLAMGEAAMREAGNQQRSYGALKAFLEMTPNPNMQREAAIPLIADLHAENQMAIDRKNYIDEYDKENQRAIGAPVPGQFLAREAMQSYDKDYPANNYQGERNHLSEIIQSKGFADLQSRLQNAKTPEQRQKLFDALDKTYGPNFHRYFTGS